MQKTSDQANHGERFISSLHGVCKLHVMRPHVKASCLGSDSGWRYSESARASSHTAQAHISPSCQPSLFNFLFSPPQPRSYPYALVQQYLMGLRHPQVSEAVILSSATWLSWAANGRSLSLCGSILDFRSQSDRALCAALVQWLFMVIYFIYVTKNVTRI